ncbi:MAG: hypothetical protein ACR2OG_08100 [Gemmatimonadaceae bacterium]
MSIDDRKSKNDVNEQGDGTVEDLKAEKVTEPEAEEVKGGVTPNDISITKHIDKSSPILL